MDDSLKIFLNEKEFEIPSYFRYFNDIDPDIIQKLKTNKQYIVKSVVQEQTLNSFINFWINKAIPDFTLENISEYDQLSQEFDLMKEVILIYKRSMEQIKIKETEIQQINFQIEENSDFYQKIIDILLNRPINHRIKNKIFDAIQEEDIEKVDFYTQPIFSYKNFLLVLNEDDKTAGIILCEKQKQTLTIPKTIEFYLGDFDITFIHEEAFKDKLGIETVTFHYNSKLKEIRDDAFKSSSIQKIVIPNSLEKIGKRAFAYCHNLKNVEFVPYSNLKYIGESAFEGCGIKSLSIPSNYIEFGESWCFWVHDLIDLKVSPSKQNCMLLYENKLLLMKSDPKSDTFDILILASRNITSVKVPPFVRKISDCAFSKCKELKVIEFSVDSEIEVIGKKALNESSIETLIIPSSVEKFESEWCSETYELTNIKILQNEKENIICYQNKMILGKSDLTSQNFDILYFACRDIESVNVPSFIKIIGSCAFDSSQIQSVTFSEDSELFSIEKYAFQHSRLTSISIPYRITKIDDFAFFECEELVQIDIPSNSEICGFGLSSLYYTAINSLYIPSKVVEFKSEWCDNTQNLNKIIVSPKNKNFMFFDNAFLLGKSDPSNSCYDVLILARRDVIAPMIPSFIKRIASCAFNFCDKLKTVIFTKDSKLEVIEEDAFSCSSIQKVKLPASLKEIKYSGFDECSDLKVVEFEENCQLRTIEYFAFHNDPITSFVFTPHLRKIENETFHCTEIKIIEISEGLKFPSFSSSIFVGRYPRLVMVPSKIRKYFNFY